MHMLRTKIVWHLEVMLLDAIFNNNQQQYCQQCSLQKLTPATACSELRC